MILDRWFVAAVVSSTRIAQAWVHWHYFRDGEGTHKTPLLIEDLWKLNIADGGGVTLLSGVATGTLPYSRDHTSFMLIQTNLIKCTGYTHIEENNRFLLLGMIVQVKSLGFHSMLSYLYQSCSQSCPGIWILRSGHKAGKWPGIGQGFLGFLAWTMDTIQTPGSLQLGTGLLFHGHWLLLFTLKIWDCPPGWGCRQLCLPLCVFLGQFNGAAFV